MSLNIHKNIIEKIDYFIENKKIPHIIFFGPSGSGKRYVLNYLINNIYLINILIIYNIIPHFFN